MYCLPTALIPIFKFFFVVNKLEIIGDVTKEPLDRDSNSAHCGIKSSHFWC